MKLQLRYSMFILLLFSGIGLAQAPAPAREGSLGTTEVSADVLLPIKDTNLSHYGFGGQVTASHFFRHFDDHVGVQVEADYLRTHGFNFHDTGVRVGPTVRFSTGHSVQPYVRALFGYSGVKASFLGRSDTYHNGGSFLGGGGVEFPLSRGLFGRIGADIQYDWTVKTQLARGLVGIAYQFGNK